jgi:hypothetical protein
MSRLGASCCALVAVSWLALAPATAETISGYQVVTWDDFQGPAPTGEEDAEIDTGVNWSYGSVEAKPDGAGGFTAKLKDVKTSSYMNERTSGKKDTVVPGTPEANALLKHEQYHLDISENFARELEKALNGIEGKGATAAEAIADAKAKATEAAKKNKEELDKTQKEYDERTQHGTDADKQAEWCKKIAAALKGEDAAGTSGHCPNGTLFYDAPSGHVQLISGPMISFADQGVPFADPFMMGGQIHVSSLLFEGFHMAPAHPLCVAPDPAPPSALNSGGGMPAMIGRVRLLMGDVPDNRLRAWMAEIELVPLALQSSQLLQRMSADLATGTTLVMIDVQTPIPMSAATSNWTVSAAVPAMIRLGTTICAWPGDLDGDGDVDQSDLGILLANYGCAAPPCSGDVDGDGDTDQSDLGALLAHYGATCPIGTVP